MRKTGQNRGFAALALCAACLLPRAAAAQSPGLALNLPQGAALAAETVTDAAGTFLPDGPAGTLSRPPGIEAEGRVTRRAWRLPGNPATPLELIAPIRDQLAAAGYDLLYDCADASCGGFDFRFALDLIPAPDMFVDLGDYRYLLARGRDRGAVNLIAILASRAGGDGYVHVTRVTPALAPAAGETAAADSTKAEPEPTPEPATDLTDRLTTDGHAILTGITFAPGAATLGAGPFPLLKDLARILSGNPDLTVLLVGHTDAVGTLAENTRLSQARAEAVRSYLIDQLGAPASRLTAAGAGYLAPIASNASEAGRRANRRVEAVALTR